MANVKVFQKQVKGHGQVQEFKIYGTVGSNCHNEQIYVPTRTLVPRGNK